MMLVNAIISDTVLLRIRRQYCEIVPEHFTWGSGGCGSVPGTGVWRTGGSEPDDEEEEDARRRKRGSGPEAGRARIDRAAGAKRRRRPQGDMLTD